MSYRTSEAHIPGKLGKFSGQRLLHNVSGCKVEGIDRIVSSPRDPVVRRGLGILFVDFNMLRSVHCLLRQIPPKVDVPVNLTLILLVITCKQSI